MKAWIRKSGGTAALALLALWVAGPATAKGNKNPGAEWVAARQLSSTTVMSGLRTGYNRPTLFVAQSACQWLAAMAVLTASNSLEAGPEPEPPGVDWTQQSAVVVAMGTVPCGYSLDVQEARQNSGVLLLQIHVGYQTSENNYEDDNPAAVVLVDGHGINSVQAMYDLAVPGLLDQALLIPCGVTRSFGLGRTSGSLDVGPTISMTWGSLKSVYR